MKKHDKKFDLVLKLLFVIGIVVLLKGLVIPGIRDIPNVLQRRYEVVEGYALNHAGTSDRKMPKLVTIKPDDGEEIRLRFYSTYPIEEGEYLKVIYLPNLKRGTLLEKSGKDGD